MKIVERLKLNQLAWSIGFKRMLLPFAFVLLLINTSCHHKNDLDQTVTPTSIPSNNAIITNLVSDTTSYQAKIIDKNLVNAWGIALNPNGNFWISANGTGRALIYDKTGASQGTPVGIPFNGNNFGGAPSGVVYAGNSGFMITGSGELAKFIFVTEDGTIQAWASGATTVTMVDNSTKGAVYKGVTIASDGSSNFIYATNFSDQKVEVYDLNFNYVATKTFTDPNLPPGFGPFNIQNINGDLYVTYAKVGPGGHDDVAGVGNGYVNVFSPSGAFIQRFASQGVLNSPWGIAVAPNGFGSFGGAILIGNFGDGHISAFTANGGSMGQLTANNTPITIDGLWGLQVGLAGDNSLYFTAGPAHENHGLFGYISISGSTTTSSTTNTVVTTTTTTTTGTPGPNASNGLGGNANNGGGTSAGSGGTVF